jgi:hypothetical protein
VRLDGRGAEVFCLGFVLRARKNFSGFEILKV